MKQNNIIVALVWMTSLVLGSCINESVEIYDLRCGRRIDPVGIDSPSFSWKIRTEEEGFLQTAREVEIASSVELLEAGKADIWRTGRQKSDEQFNIKPEGVVFSDATTCYWRVRIWDNSGKKSKWSPVARFTTGLKNEQSWSAQWITRPEAESETLPCFRKVFRLEKDGIPPEKVIVYFCGLGAGELYLNGSKIDSTRFLDPAQTNYEHYALYTAFDITDRMKLGDNCLGVMLGDGWFAQDKAWHGAPFGYGKPMFRLQLVALFHDGSRQLLGSDESWTWADGPVVRSNIYLGESYDARREVKGWSRAEANCYDWKPAVAATAGIPPRLLPQLIEPIRTHEVVRAVELWQDPSGNWIFDFGVNQAGIPLLKVRQPEGTRLSIRMAEEKNSDGSLDFRSLGSIHHGPVFGHEYTCKGAFREQWSPRFSYHGFRYAELSGYSGKPDLSTLSLVLVHSDLAQTGLFRCADPQVNRLHEMAVRTLLSNLHGIPTDCPDREKCGWLGDAHAYVKMANLNLQMDNFWMKYLEDIRSGALAQKERTLFHERHNNTFYYTAKPSGIPYMVAPGKRVCGVASPDWGTALVQIPWWLYVYYGNKEVLRDFYPDMKQWTDYVATLASDTARTGKYNNQTRHIVYQGLGDWCPPEGNQAIDTPIEFTSTSFHYLDVSIMEQTALILGEKSDALKYAEMKKAIAGEMIAQFYNADEKSFGSQTANVLALDLGLVPPGDEKAVSDAVVRNMKEKHEGFMHCGIFGIGRIGSMLARNGNAESAWTMFTRKGENSFEWMWADAGATSLWEALPVSIAGRQSAEEASHNHPMQAGYDICFYEEIAGIRPDDSKPGFKTIRFHPRFTSQLDWAEATIESPYGPVTSNWRMEKGKLKWLITIPANSTGLVALPSDLKYTVNGEIMKNRRFKPVGAEGEFTLRSFPSGQFEIKQEE